MAKHRGRPKKTPVSRGLWLIIALFIAAFALFLLMITKPAQRAEQKPTTPPINSIKKPNPEKTKPKFEFYNILPEKQIASPRNTPKKPEKNTRKPKTKPIPKKPSTYWVQVAAFQQFEEADELKAELAFLGFPVTIQTAAINGQKWYRVRSGPFKTEADAQKVQKEFSGSDITSKVVAEPAA